MLRIHHTVSNDNVLAESGRRGLQRDAVVVRVGYHTTHNDVVTAIQVQRIIIIIVTVHDLDTVDSYTVAGQIVLHPTAAVTQRNVLDHDVTTLYESQQVWTCDALVVPRLLGKHTPLSVYRSVAVNHYILSLVGIYQLYRRRMRSQ